MRHIALALAIFTVLSCGAGAQDCDLILEKADGYHGIWYSNQPQKNEYVYKYSGGLGTYCAKHIPFAVYRPEVDMTFFVYGGTRGKNETLLHMVSYYDHATGEVPQPTILLDKKTTDAHDNPVLTIDDDGHLWVFCSSHGTSRPSYILKSKKPYDIDDFECVKTTNFSYPGIHYVPGSGFLLLHTRYQNGHRRLFQWTSKDGVEWDEPEMLAYIEWGHYAVSQPAKDGCVGMAFNMHPQGKGLNWRTNLYYMETPDMGETWQAADGQEIELPLTERVNPALVKSYAPEEVGATGRNVYMKDIAFDADGRPVILFVTSGGWEAGPGNAPRIWQTARWTGTEWDIQGTIRSDNNYDTGNLTIEEDGTWRIVGPTEVGPQPFNPGGEVAMWTSRDQGRTWQQLRQLTSESTMNHTYCRKPVNSHPDFHSIWADGHGRKPSESRLYFCNREGRVFMLPTEMDAKSAKPAEIE